MAATIALSESLSNFNVTKAITADSDWQCEACTYANAGGRTLCEMCETPKPNKSDSIQMTTESMSEAQLQVFTSLQAYLQERKRNKDKKEEHREKEKDEEKEGEKEKEGEVKESEEILGLCHELQLALTIFSTLIESSSAGIKRDLADPAKEIFDTILALHKILPHSAGFAKASMQFIYILCRHLEFIRQALDSTELECIKAAMKLHPGNTGIQALGLMILSTVLTYDFINFRTVSESVASFLADPENVLLLLSGLANVDHHYDKLAHQIDPLLAFITTRPEAPGAGAVILNFLQDMANLGQSENDVSVVEQVSAALATFCQHDQAVRWAAVRVVQLTQQLERFAADNPEISRNCQDAINAIQQRNVGF